MNRLMPNEKFNAKAHPDREEDHVDFMLTCNLRDRTDTTITTKLSDTGTRMINVKILSKNIDGIILERLKPDAALLIDINLHKPHVVVIQEHQHDFLNTAAFKKMTQMTCYQLVMHAKARRNEDGTRRPLAA